MILSHASIADDMKTNRAYSNIKSKKTIGFKPKYNYEKEQSYLSSGLKKNKLI